jgi:hypothetical protein
LQQRLEQHVQVSTAATVRIEQGQRGESRHALRLRDAQAQRTNGLLRDGGLTTLALAGFLERRILRAWLIAKTYTVCHRLIPSPHTAL